MNIHAKNIYLVRLLSKMVKILVFQRVNKVGWRNSFVDRNFALHVANFVASHVVL